MPHTWLGVGYRRQSSPSPYLARGERAVVHPAAHEERLPRGGVAGPQRPGGGATAGARHPAHPVECGAEDLAGSIDTEPHCSTVRLSHPPDWLGAQLTS
jgi:hypothetical protein